VTVFDDPVQSPAVPPAASTPVYTALKVSLVGPLLKVDPFQTAKRFLNAARDVTGAPPSTEPEAVAAGVAPAFPEPVAAVFPVAVLLEGVPAVTPAEEPPADPQPATRIAATTARAGATATPGLKFTEKGLPMQSPLIGPFRTRL
jgi:hypothetical protein